MQAINLVKYLSDLMTAHDIPIESDDEWVVPNGQLPAIRAFWHPRENHGRLNVDVLLDDKRIIYECFAGVGEGEAGIHDAMENFSVNSFHVLLAAFWQLNDDEQVTVEEWSLDGKSYIAYIGNFGTRSSDNTPKISDGLFEAIEKTIRGDKLEYELNWFRFFVSNVKGEYTFEALKNNNEWQSGLEALKSVSWPPSDGYYSVRNFLILKENQ